MKTSIKPFVDLLHKHGFCIDSMRQNKHCVARVTHETGFKAIVTFPVSSGDHRGIKNLEAHLKRTLRDNRP